MKYSHMIHARATYCLLLCLVILSITLGISKEDLTSTVQDTSGKLETSFTEEGVVNVLGIRAWQSPGQRFKLMEKIPKESFYYWLIDSMPITLGWIWSEGDEKVWTSVEAYVYGENGKVARTSYFSRKWIRKSKSQGQFLEILLLFRNKGKEALKEVISSSDQSSLNISLILREGEKRVNPIDFLIPGLSLESLEKEDFVFVTEFSGNLFINLEPAGETWALLLYDVPMGTKSAQLQIKDDRSLNIQWK